MDLKKIETKLNNLKTIHQRLSNEKNILLIDMIKQNALLNYYVKNALWNQNIISLLQKEYKIKNNLINESKTSKNKLVNKLKSFVNQDKQLWIYVTEEQKYSTDSYSRYENHILNTIKKKNADFITIGNRAKEFCTLNKLNVIYNVDQKQAISKLSWILTLIVKFLFSQYNYNSLHFVINSNKNKENSFIILPLTKFNVNSLTESKSEFDLTDIKEFKIFPDINNYIQTQIDNFIENSIQSLLVESSFYKTKNELIKTNKTINEVDEEVKKLNKKIIRIKREKEIEEIVLLTSNNKKFLIRRDQ
ncbi:hypothetical protein MFERI14815_00307 [Mycoplasma feriruminatoris]|uniref:MSC_0622 family F1-like ATPase gamma subunit n=1 Tax=Mycoplasma feriruminatoris TaxID=1179777 RepID=UPI00241DA641|nr:hypothetical protein [Mycoplasma feriruminatoris]WFQ91703.1 hypothetical protein MFERI14815_00307 [Mycoplasma feriruminatoris]